MRLYIVRHGETDWNKGRRIQGQVDIPLNEFGRHLAVETGKGLADIPFMACFSSPLKRAVETARLILGDRELAVTMDGRIEEMAFGIWEGRCCSKEGWDLPQEFHDFFEAPGRYRAPEGGEDFYMVRERLADFLEELYRREDLQDGNVLIATHGAALCGMLNVMKNRPMEEYWGEGVHKNCAVTEVEVTGGVPVILSEGRTYYKDEVAVW